MAHNAPTQWRTIAASCTIGILVGAGTANYAIIGKVAENGTLLTGVRRDVELQRSDFQSEQRRTDDRMNKQQDMVREFIALLKEQNVLLQQMTKKP